MLLRAGDVHSRLLVNASSCRDKAAALVLFQLFTAGVKSMCSMFSKV